MAAFQSTCGQSVVSGELAVDPGRGIKRTGGGSTKSPLGNGRRIKTVNLGVDVEWGAVMFGWSVGVDKVKGGDGLWALNDGVEVLDVAIGSV